MFNMRAQMGKLMETIQVVARGQKAIARGQEDLLQANQRVDAAINPLAPAGLAVQIPMGLPMGVPPYLGGGLMDHNIMLTVNPSVLEVDDLTDSFFSQREESIYDVVGPTSVEIERKFPAIEEKMKAMDGSNGFGLDAAEMSLVLGIQIPTKFKVTLKSTRESVLPEHMSGHTARKWPHTLVMRSYSRTSSKTTLVGLHWSGICS